MALPINIQKTFKQLVDQRTQPQARTDLGVNTAAISGEMNSYFGLLIGGNTWNGDQTIIGSVNIISGSLNQVSVSSLNIEDQYVVTNSLVSGSPILDGGLLVNRGTSTDANVKWNETSDSWEVGTESQVYTEVGPDQILRADDAVSAPGYSYINDADTGLARTAADTLSLVVGGTRMLTTINTGASIYGGLVVGDSISSGDAQLEIGANRTANGNAYVDLHGTSGSDFNLRLIRYPGYNGTAELIQIGPGDLTVGTVNTGSLRLSTNSSTRTIITSTGRMGIGTVTPSMKVHISDTTQADDDGMIQVQNSTAGIANAGMNTKNHYGTSQFMQWEDYGIRFGSRIVTNGGKGAINFTTGVDSISTIISAGRMRIGNGLVPGISPSHVLQVDGNASIGDVVTIANTSYGTSSAVPGNSQFVSGGALYFKGSSGTITLLAPA